MKPTGRPKKKRGIKNNKAFEAAVADASPVMAGSRTVRIQTDSTTWNELQELIAKHNTSLRFVIDLLVDNAERFSLELNHSREVDIPGNAISAMAHNGLKTLSTELKIPVSHSIGLLLKHGLAWLKTLPAGSMKPKRARAKNWKGTEGGEGKLSYYAPVVPNWNMMERKGVQHRTREGFSALPLDWVEEELEKLGSSFVP